MLSDVGFCFADIDEDNSHEKCIQMLFYSALNVTKPGVYVWASQTLKDMIIKDKNIISVSICPSKQAVAKNREVCEIYHKASILM